jgi:glycosyltransferase involved in cell wall biosynthesis
MKILVLHQYFVEKGGSGGTRFNEMTQQWSKMGHQVTVLAGMVHYATGKKHNGFKGHYFVKEENFYPGVDVIWCHVSESYNINFLGRLWGYFSFVFSSIWAGLFKTSKGFDAVLVTSPPLFIAISGILISFFKRIPLVFEVRDLWPESAIDTGVITNKWLIKFSYWFEKRVYSSAKLINVLTPAFKEKLITTKNVSPHKIIMIPNAADFEMTEEVKNRFNINEFKKEKGLENKFVVTYAGAHGVANHLIQLVEAAEILKETNLLIVLIGSGMRKKALQEKVEELHLKNVKFLDPIPKSEVLEYILASDLGASVLKNVDTFKTIYSNKTFDYMSCKKPVLLAIDGVSRELVEAADCGLFAKPEDSQDIADKIMFYIQNPEIGKRHGDNGYIYAKEHFDRTKLANSYIDHIGDSI